MSLFKGTANNQSAYVTKTDETPRWMQDAIYNQIQTATNIANIPYQAYNLPTVAELSPLQQQAYTQIQNQQGDWQAGMTAAQTGVQAALNAPGGAAAASGALGSQKTALDSLNYQQASNTLSPYVGQALGMSGVTSAQPYMDTASGWNTQAGGAQTAPGLQAAQGQYLNQAAGGQGYWDQAGNTTAQSISERAMAAANPYLQAAGQSAAGGIQGYMNPYTSQVTDRIAQLGGRNLSENLLPQVSDQFIRAGQFGGSRMGEFGARALRDTQESVLGQQAQALQQGYGQALGASQADLARQAQLAGTAGGIAGADLSRVQQGAAQYGNLGNMQTQAGQAQQQFGLSAAGAAQQAQAQDYARMLQASQQQAGIGSQMGALTQAQQQAILQGGNMLSQAQSQALGQQLQGASQYGQMAQTQGALTNQDLQRQLSGYGQLAGLNQQQQQMGFADAGALESAGKVQQGQNQAQLDAAYRQSQAPQDYMRNQADWMSTQIRGMAPSVPSFTTQQTQGTGQTYSPSGLAQLASAYSVAKGIEKA